MEMGLIGIDYLIVFIGTYVCRTEDSTTRLYSS